MILMEYILLNIEKKLWYCIYRYINIVKFIFMYNLKVIIIILFMVGNIMKCVFKFILLLINVYRVFVCKI